MKTYIPKESAIEAMAKIQIIAKESGLTINELAKNNGCPDGYRLMQKLQREGVLK